MRIPPRLGPLRADLYKEYSDAMDLDYMFGIGMPEGYGVNGSVWRSGMRAKLDLIVRACAKHGAARSAILDSAFISRSIKRAD
jgi:hypothetical protein